MAEQNSLLKLIESLLKSKQEFDESWRFETLSSDMVKLEGPEGTLAVFTADAEGVLARREIEVEELIEIGKDLSATRDLDQLLNHILEKARHLAGADAGSIYVIEGDDEPIEKKTLRFKLSQNDSLDYESKEFTIPVSTESIAGAAAVMKRTINIEDVRKLPDDAPYHYDPTFDERSGYSTRSVLAVPMINLHGEVQGVVQLLNKKRDPSVKLKSPEDFDREVVPMEPHSQQLVETLASQAGVAMENAFLNQEIQHIFDGFVRASVHAIEQRDPRWGLTRAGPLPTRTSRKSRPRRCSTTSERWVSGRRCWSRPRSSTRRTSR
jgi:hypothetical protein